MFKVISEKIHDKIYYQIKTPEGNNYCGLLGIKKEAERITHMLNERYFGENAIEVPKDGNYRF